MKSFKSLKSIKYPLLLGPVISAFLLVTIITASPLTISQDTISPKLAAPVTVTSNSTVSKSNPTTQVQTAAPLKAAPAKTNTDSLSAAAKQRQVQQSNKQPSRSLSLNKPHTTNISPYSSQYSKSAKAKAVISTSKQYIGVNYVYGGTTPAGFDCSGFVRYVFAKNGIILPRVSRDQFHVGTSVSRSNLQPGDLVFFSLAKNGIVDHEGIYVGNNQFINASSSKGVTIYTLGSYWQSAYIGAKRVI